MMKRGSFVGRRGSYAGVSPPVGGIVLQDCDYRNGAVFLGLVLPLKQCCSRHSSACCQ